MPLRARRRSRRHSGTLFHAILLGGLLFHLNASNSHAVVTAGSVAPISAKGANIPNPYQPYIYTLFPSSSISISSITDQSLNTFVELEGLDNTLQANGVRVDTGTFYLLKYQIDPAASEFRINFIANVNYPSGAQDLFIEALSPDGQNSYTIEWDSALSGISEISATFSRNNNSGNQPTFANIGLNKMLNADGSLYIVLQAGYGASMDAPGHVVSRLYDVSASFTVPEPSAVTWLGAIMICAASPRRQKARRNL